ncbi:DUF420 domain-containing protein [Paenibacillus yanchengensis]|uniref:DUF420 domain-containing protein n=1 Tax=Paenibacillus yanchengensis TaxID=2035833 RepID=A0ABW4YJ98_9BACL
MNSFNLLPTISTFFIVLSAVLVAVGWRLILQGKREQHQKVMIYAAIAAVLFFIVYLSRTVFLGNTPWSGPASVKPFYITFLLFHIILATAAAVFGITTITLGYKKKYSRHRKLGRITATIWFITAITGVAVYALLYLIYPGDEVVPLLDAIFG